MSDSGLVVNGLMKTYPNGVRALNGVDLEIESGLYGLLGPNGAGKSTLMRTIATLQDPDAGSISLDGVDTLSAPDVMRQRLGYLPQHIGAYPNTSGKKLLERFAWLKGRTDKKERNLEVTQLLERVNLSDAAHRAVSTYSGGMLRRFGIAMALIGNPRLLIVDEPTAGLDPAERRRFHGVLADVAEGAAVLLSTHIVEDVESLCEQLTIMNAGRSIAQGSVEDLKQALDGKLWSKLVGRGEPLGEHLHASATPKGTRVVRFADERPGDAWRPHVPNLEDVYHHALSQEAA